MIIDADCHISPTSQGGNSLRIEELLEQMDRSNVDQAVIWLQPPYVRTETSAANDYVAEATRRYPDRFLGFGWADPNLGVDTAVEEVRRGLDEHGFFGIKLNGAQNWFVIDDPGMALPVIDEIAKRDAVLALHVGADAYDNTSPMRVANIARRYPDLRILAIHMGGVAHPDQTRAMIEVAQEFEHITLIGSEVKPIPVLRAIKTLGAHRVAFGSDTPFELMRVELAKYRALLEAEVSEADQAMIWSGTIRHALRLDS